MRRWSNNLFAIALLPWLASCADDSYAVVAVLTYAGSVDGVAQLRVHVESGGAQETLFYPNQPSESLHLDTATPSPFRSSSARPTSARQPSRSSPSTSMAPPWLTANPPSQSPRTRWSASQCWSSWARSDPSTVWTAVAQRTVAPVYSPAIPTRLPRPVARIKPAAFYAARHQPAIGMCYAAGPGKPGDTCADNNECAPGSQCFTFTAAGCSVMTCLRFCNNDDAMCGEQGAYCNVPIQCGTTPPFAACSRPCDPTGTGAVGCATGLSCFVYTGETTDCACAGQGDLGAACSQNSGCNGEANCAGCRAGLSCVVPTGSAAGASGACRPICALAAPACPSGTTCHAFEGSTHLVYGFCQ